MRMYEYTKKGTKLCKYCKSEIPENAKFCVNCGKKQGGKAKWIIIAIVFILFIGLFSDDSDDNSTTESTNSTTNSTTNVDKNETPNSTDKEEENTEEKVVDEFTYRDMVVKYLKHEIVVDDVDQTVLVVYYDFTNNSDKNKTFDYSFSDTCFQNGVEVEHSWWHVNDESHNSGKEIKPGTTITVASSFVLGESQDDIELEITPWVGSKVLFEKKLSLDK